MSVCLALFCYAKNPPVQAAVDIRLNLTASPLAEGQTLSQADTQSIAEHFFPRHVWFHPDESCAWPATPESSGVVVYRVREHPRDAAMLSVTYSLLYRNDCGGIFGWDNHPGDVESFSYTLVPDTACSIGWRLFAVKTTAHSGAPGDVGEQEVNSCEALPEIFVSFSKHGTYLTVGQCNRNIDPVQRCARGFTTDFILNNAGDPENPLIDDLSEYFPPDPTATVEYVWSGDGRFCGGQKVDDRQDCVSSAGNKLTDDSLLAPARQFNTLFELGKDWQSESQATSIAFGDIDGDGIDEIGVTRKTNQNNRVYIFDDAHQSFKTLLATGHNWPIDSYATAIAFGDVDDDGLAEIGVIRRADNGYLLYILDDALHEFTVLFSGVENGDGFTYPVAIAFGDVDGDPNDEIGVALQASIGVRFFVLDDFSNGFIPIFGGGENWDMNSFATAIAFGDVDGDGIDEIGINRETSGGARFFLLDDAPHGFSVLLTGGEDWDPDRQAKSIAFGDVDGDGLDEVGVTRGAINIFDHREIRYWILDDALHEFQYLKQGGGGEPTLFPVYYEFKLAFGDADGNGKAEVGIGRTHYANARYWILDDTEFGFNTTLVGSGGSEWNLERFVTSLSFGDVNGDGIDEIGLTLQSSAGTRLQVRSIVKPVLEEPLTVLIGLGDSLTHGTMDGTNNAVNTVNAYLQKVSDSIAQVIPLMMRQPLFDLEEKRLPPYQVPTNLGVDGSDIFSMEGFEYYKRVGADESLLSSKYLCDKLLPFLFKDKYDKVLYPINLLAGNSVSTIDSAIWLLNQGLPSVGLTKSLIVFWSGNNDSSKAALGAGGLNPTFQPLPFDILKSELDPILTLLLAFGELAGVVSFEPYTQAAIERNLTDLQDFAYQYFHVLNRLRTETAFSGVNTELFLLTLPYYSAVGYLIDSEDLEFYLRKLNPAYTVPATFKRVAPPGEPITEPLKGDRISLLTFGMMYALLSTGHSVSEVNRALEIDGQQRDGLVLSEEEQQFIMSRIDGYNAVIKFAAAVFGPNVHLSDIGQFINDTFTGEIVFVINDRTLSRKWVRGSGFSLDGVHPGYLGQALVANYILEDINAALGISAPLYDPSPIMATDPYFDGDEDGWAPGPAYEGSGITKLLFLFKDPDDSNPSVQAEMPPNVWDLISEVLLGEVLNIRAIRQEAQRLGIVSEE
jgi:hypothetical protein